MYFGCDKKLSERYALVKAAGFDSVMIWWGDSFEEKREQLLLAERHDLQILNAHLPFNKINSLWSDKPEGEELSNWLCSELIQCGQHGVPAVVLHLSRGLNPPPLNSLGLNRIKRAVEIAEKYKVNIALENLRNLDYLDYVMQNISSQRLGFCYDSGHNNCFNPEIDVLKAYRDRLFALHLNDNYGDEDTHLLPFDGTVDWTKVISNLKEVNYQSAVSLEVQMDRHPMYADLSAEEYLSRAFNRAERIEQLILV